MTKTRVGYVGPLLELSGSTMVMLDVLNHLDRAKYEPHLIIRPGSDMEAAHLLRNDIKIHDARYLRTWWSRLFIKEYRFKRYLAHKIRSRIYDIFIVDQNEYNYLFSNFKKKFDIKIINRVGSIKSWRVEHFNEKAERKRAIKLLPYSDAIIVPSQLAKNDLVNNFGINQNKIKVIYNALDLDKIEKNSSEKLNYTTNAKTLLYVGRLISKKTPMLLLEAFKELNSQNINIELWFVGDGVQKKQLEEYVEENDLKACVKFWGFQKNPYKYFKQADVFVHTSQVDGFGIALMEAAYFNLPIVYSDTLVGANELLKKHNIGYPFDINSKADLIDKIKTALNQPKKKYFHLLKPDISIEKFIAKVEKVIDETIGS
jgi:glycosyltransferase involved in cell wall biosynthesis